MNVLSVFKAQNLSFECESEQEFLSQIFDWDAERNEWSQALVQPLKVTTGCQNSGRPSNNTQQVQLSESK